MVLKSKSPGVQQYLCKRGWPYKFNPRFGPKNEVVDPHGICLVKKDADAQELLERYPKELEVVPERDWPEHLKASLKDFEEDQEREMAEEFPDVYSKLKKVGKTVKDAVLPALPKVK